MKQGTTPKYWTPQEHARLVAMVDEGKKWPEIAATLCRSISAVMTRHHDFRNGGGYRTTRREKAAAEAAARAVAAAAAPVEHTSITSAFFGDPLPGRSALDQRQAQSDVRSISLAGGGL